MKWKITYLYRTGPEAVGLLKVTEFELEKALREVIDREYAACVVDIHRVTDVGETVLVENAEDQDTLRQVAGSRRWHKSASEQGGYWTEINERDEDLPGLWEHDGTQSVMVCKVDNTEEFYAEKIREIQAEKH